MSQTAAMNLAASARLTATGNGAAVNIQALTGAAILVLNASATEGAGMTLDTKIQHSDDGSTNWTDSGVAFAQVTNAAASFQQLTVSADQFKKFVRVVDTLAGSSPAVTRSVSIIGKKAFG